MPSAPTKIIIIKLFTVGKHTIATKKLIYAYYLTKKEKLKKKHHNTKQLAKDTCTDIYGVYNV